ncbi:uncharacterized protein BCR38DRAFT_459566 [Pseudomassariella vexata]|uniref:Palmitoyltransferase n=1 Tax=Pseudomassariella vexata TaxID=1141098 RepID=A0A1Y2DRH5_9PEZI|nr:uncharacterized protein BCR38DRAFT_459566 [Pseudomassariella vexata]ORY61789.1 hypothetical protein BCR38DRAFT_459566 [Pseudomassariella vexata]
MKLSIQDHLPTIQYITPSAFLYPMSSQKLQAQRRGVPSLNLRLQPGAMQKSKDVVNIKDTRHNIKSNPLRARQLSNDEVRPHSPWGTEGHHPTVRLLQKKKAAERKGLGLNMDKSSELAGNLPNPTKSPRSFRLGFLLPTNIYQGGNGSKRSIPGGEKLESQRFGTNSKYLHGNTVFFLGRRLQTTRDHPMSIATGFSIVLPAVLFFIFSAPWLWHNISPFVPLILAYIFYICISSFLHTSASDLGILPRNIHNPFAPENQGHLVLTTPSTDWTLIKSAESSTGFMEISTKYCKTCHIWRPPRAHHSRLCDNCFQITDHHCVWINNWPPKLPLILCISFVGRKSVPTSHSAMLSINFVSPLLVGLMYTAALTAYHVFLMACGETTREFLNSHNIPRNER